jgi:hypothetical protein
MFNAATFTEWAADTLARVFGYGMTGAKRVADVAEVNVATARNWHEARNAMQAFQLANLCAESDELLAEFLAAIGRADLADAARRDAVIAEIRTVLARLDAR